MVYTIYTVPIMKVQEIFGSIPIKKCYIIAQTPFDQEGVCDLVCFDDTLIKDIEAVAISTTDSDKYVPTSGMLVQGYGKTQAKEFASNTYWYGGVVGLDKKPEAKLKDKLVTINGLVDKGIGNIKKELAMFDQSLAQIGAFVDFKEIQGKLTSFLDIARKEVVEQWL